MYEEFFLQKGICAIRQKAMLNPISDPYVRKCLLEKTLVLGHRHFEVGWPVPFLAAFAFPVFPPGLHSLFGDQ